jgi:hypothetical protein
MTAGKGFIALAALIFAKWKPVPAMFTCLLFGFLDALQIRLQGSLPLIGVRSRCRSSRRCPIRPDRRAARRLHRQGDPAQGRRRALRQGALMHGAPTCSRPRAPRWRRPTRPIRNSRSARRSLGMSKAVDVLSERLNGLRAARRWCWAPASAIWSREVEDAVRILLCRTARVSGQRRLRPCRRDSRRNLRGVPVLMLAGRAHYYEHGDAAAMRPALETLAGFGVEKLILTNAAGSLDEPTCRRGQSC